MTKLIKLIAILFAFQLNSISAIYNGTLATEHEFPYAVIIHSPKFFCSGALISDRHVLTAAHCVMTVRKGGSAEVNVGAHDYYDVEPIYSKKFWMHENFTMPSAVYDIAIIELPTPLTLSNKIKPLKISTKHDADLDAEDKDVYLAGWGYTSDYSGPSDKLQYTKMKLITLNECKKYKSHYIEDLNENHICSEMTKGMPCSGDSGASLVSVKTNKIIGVMSYVKDAENGIDINYNDCRSKVPAVSTRISSYLDWISEKTGIDFKHEKPTENEIDIDDNDLFQRPIKHRKIHIN